MKAIRIHAFGDPDVLKLEEIPVPTPGPGQVRVAIHAIGVNPVDTYIRSGIYGAKDFPYTPGFDAAGIVEEVVPPAATENVGQLTGGPLKPGDRVYVSRTVTGTYAEKTIVDQGYAYPLPPHITFAQGAAVGVPYGTAHRSFFHRAQAKPGETVLIHGATGGVGIASVQLARAFGCIVIGTGGSDAGRKLVLKEGAHHVLDHHEEGYLKKLMDLTGGKGVDIILEMLANVNLASDLTVLAKNGRVIVVGNRGKIEINPRDTMARDADIRGVTINNATVADLIGIHSAIRAGLENGSLRPIIEQEMPLADAARAHIEVMEGNSHGKIVLIP